jgi:hypothetical protein
MSKVTIDKRELDRLRNIEATTRAFVDKVERTGTKAAISRLLNKAAREKECTEVKK